MTTYKKHSTVYYDTSASSWYGGTSMNHYVTYSSADVEFAEEVFVAAKKMRSKKLKDNNKFDVEKYYEEIKDSELVKLLESIGEFPEGVVTPILMAIPDDVPDVLGFLHNIAIQTKHPSATKIVTVRKNQIQSTLAVDNQTAKKLVYSPGSAPGIIIPLVVMLNILKKDQNKMEQSLLIKRGSSLIETLQGLLSVPRRDGTLPKIKPEPLIIITQSLESDDIEEAAAIAGVSEIEEVKEDNLSYIKLTF